MDEDDTAEVTTKKRKSSGTDDQPSDGILFKEDGTAIRNTSAYVAGIKKNGYTEKLFTADGDEIRDPVSYVEKKGVSVPDGPRNAKRQKTGGIFKADGTAIKNPVAYVAGISKNGYNEPLFDAAGQKIKNPVNYVAAMDNNGSGYAAASKMMMPMPMPFMFGPKMAMPGISGGLEKPLFTSKGMPIRNPEAYIEGIKKKGHNEPVFDAQGSIIKNPIAYVEKALINAKTSGGTIARKSGAKSGSQNGAKLVEVGGSQRRQPFKQGALRLRGQASPMKKLKEMIGMIN